MAVSEPRARSLSFRNLNVLKSSCLPDKVRSVTWITMSPSSSKGSGVGGLCPSASSTIAISRGVGLCIARMRWPSRLPLLCTIAISRGVGPCIARMRWPSRLPLLCTMSPGALPTAHASYPLARRHHRPPRHGGSIPAPAPPGTTFTRARQMKCKKRKHNTIKWTKNVPFHLSPYFEELESRRS